MIQSQLLENLADLNEYYLHGDLCHMIGVQAIWVPFDTMLMMFHAVHQSHLYFYSCPLQCIKQIAGMIPYSRIAVQRPNYHFLYNNK